MNKELYQYNYNNKNTKSQGIGKLYKIIYNLINVRF